MKEIYRWHAEICTTFSNPIRLEILDLLRGGELSVSDLVKKTGLTQANISQHLSIMKNKGIVNPSRKGKNIFYALSNPKIVRAFDIIREILRERLKGNKKLAGRWRGDLA